MTKNIVIVISEDDQGHFILMKHCLRNAGISNEIVWLADGQQTLDFICAAAENTPANPRKDFVLLLDIRMPKIDGIEVLEEIKKNPDMRNIPVIMVTSSDHPDNIQRCRALGCNGYIIKPLDDKAIQLIEHAAASVYPHA